MSSYFDNASAAHFRAGAGEEKDELRAKVVKRVGDYLEYIERSCLKAELPKLEPLKAKFQQVSTKKKDYDRDGSFMIEDLHSLGHDIGTARIRLRGRGWAGDSPYFPGHYDMEDK